MESLSEPMAISTKSFLPQQYDSAENDGPAGQISLKDPRCDWITVFRRQVAAPRCESGATPTGGCCNRKRPCFFLCWPSSGREGESMGSVGDCEDGSTRKPPVWWEGDKNSIRAGHRPSFIKSRNVVHSGGRAESVGVLARSVRLFANGPVTCHPLTSLSASTREA